ncbi:carbonic anhydrase-like [Styela clava]
MFIKLLLVTAICLLDFSADASKWDYENTDETWGIDFAQCNGEKQSPIDVSTYRAKTDQSLGVVRRSFFEKRPKSMTIANNGHSLVIGDFVDTYEINDPNVLPFTAVLGQYHLHWANTADGGGSEHLLDGKQFFGELHAVHYNKKYGSVAEAADKPDGLAVFGWFIDTKYPQENLYFGNLIYHSLRGARTAGGKMQIVPTFSLETLIPANLDSYYRYSGSLTTPPCYESVTWTVFKEPIQIDMRQANLLTTMFYGDKEGTSPLRRNFRPVQKLNGRKITKPATCYGK